MAAPTIVDFRGQFPEMNSTADSDVNAALLTAQLWFDESKWAQGDFRLAYLLWTAHYLTLRRMQSQAAAAGQGANAQLDLFVSSVSFENRRVSYSERTKTDSTKAEFPGEELLGSTMYGQLYKQVRDRNIIPILVI